jgi:hypothetical protein
MTAIDAAFEESVARAMLNELEAYLKSDVLFWQVDPNELGSRMPQLTIGGLLEALLRAQAAGTAGIESMRVALETIRQRHMVRYLDRAEKEAGSRLNLWSAYLDDYTRDRDAADYYANEVRTRLKIDLLLNELETERRGLEVRLRIDLLDRRLSGVFMPGEFVWDERLAVWLPKDEYWWLYGSLRVR